MHQYSWFNSARALANDVMRDFPDYQNEISLAFQRLFERLCTTLTHWHYMCDLFDFETEPAIGELYNIYAS